LHRNDKADSKPEQLFISVLKSWYKGNLVSRLLQVIGKSTGET